REAELLGPAESAERGPETEVVGVRDRETGAVLSRGLAEEVAADGLVFGGRGRFGRHGQESGREEAEDDEGANEHRRSLRALYGELPKSIQRVRRVLKA